jgi:YggT family protein
MSRTGFQVAGVVWLLYFVNYLCRILSLAVFVRAILSWFAMSRYNPVIVLLDDLTEPILSPLRRVVPLLGMFDITPIVAIIILNFIPYIVSRLVGFLLGF